MKDIKSKITSIFGKIRNFNFLSVLLDRKIKKLKIDLKTNKELIVHYNERIRFYKTLVEIHENDIKNLEFESRELERKIDKIKRAKEV